MKKSIPFSVGGIFFGHDVLVKFTSTPTCLAPNDDAVEIIPRDMLKCYCHEIHTNHIITDALEYGYKNPKAKEAKQLAPSVGLNYDALVFARGTQYLANTLSHNNYSAGYSFKDVNYLLSAVKNARSLLPSCLAGADDVGDYDQLIEVSGALNAIYQNVKSLLMIVAPWGERCDVKAISFTH